MNVLRFLDFVERIEEVRKTAELKREETRLKMEEIIANELKRREEMRITEET